MAGAASTYNATQTKISVRPEPFDPVRPELVEGLNGADDRLVEVFGIDDSGSTGSHPKGARTHYSPACAGISARTRKRVCEARNG